MISPLFDYFFGFLMSRYPFFRKGWGGLDKIEEIRIDPFQGKVVREIKIDWISIKEDSKIIQKRGKFKSPFQDLIFPEESHWAHFELLLPAKIKNPPICIHFAATSDQGFSRRRNILAIPLLKKGIGSLILENAYYGIRRPKNQKGFRLNRFVDLWAMVSATIEEGKSLVQWLRKNQFNSIGVTGISMGGYVAAIVASQLQQPLAVIPCIAPHSAKTVFSEGVLKNGCHWLTLQEELGEKKDAKDTDFKDVDPESPK